MFVHESAEAGGKLDNPVGWFKVHAVFPKGLNGVDGVCQTAAKSGRQQPRRPADRFGSLRIAYLQPDHFCLMSDAFLFVIGRVILSLGSLLARRTGRL